MESTTNYPPYCQPCLDELQAVQASGNTWGLCPPETCYSLPPSFHEWCFCLGPYNRPPFVQNGVCMNSIGSLIPISEQECFCCCACLGSAMNIMTSTSEAKPVHEITAGDVVLTATDKSLKTWVQAPVKFSAGTGAGTNKQIKVYYGDSSTGILVKPESFSSQTIDKETSARIFKTLSTAPNDYIDKNGRVKLDVVRSSGSFVLEELLRLPQQDVATIYELLRQDPNYLLVTSDQPFLLADQSLKRASKLIPGKDSLVRADGTFAPVYALAVSMFDKEIHHIATSDEPATSADHHLIVANGIVIADYALQLKLGIDEGHNQQVSPKTDFELKGATVQPSGTPGRSIIRLQFNQPVDAKTAQYPGYFLLMPESKSHSSAIDPNDATIVLLEAELMPQIDYSVIVSDLRSSEDRKPLVPGKNSAEFKQL